MSEFENLKEGDKVIVNYPWHEQIKEVKRITDKQIIVGGSRYWKKDGCEVGSRYSHLEIATDERIKQVKEKINKEELRAFLRGTCWEILSLESLITIADCVKKELTK